MTMQEIEELACLRFKTELFMQSFCHTAAYPKKGDPERWKTMTDTAVNCGGVALKSGDGVIHPWLNRMVIPDTVGTGGDSHTRWSSMARTRQWPPIRNAVSHACYAKRPVRTWPSR